MSTRVGSPSTREWAKIGPAILISSSRASWGSTSVGGALSTRDRRAASAAGRVHLRGGNQAYKNIVEQFDVLALEARGPFWEELRYSLNGVGPPFRSSVFNDVVKFRNKRSCCYEKLGRADARPRKARFQARPGADGNLGNRNEGTVSCNCTVFRALTHSGSLAVLAKNLYIPNNINSHTST